MTGGTTHPNAANSVRRTPPLAFYFVFPEELAGLTVPITSGLELGRESSTSVSDVGARPFAAVPHPTVSRRHAAIGASVGGSVPTLIDHGARNGTRVNGQQLTGATPLLPQSVVRFGDTIAVVDELLPAGAPLAGMPPGRSPDIVRLRELLPRVAEDRAPVLIAGETGTGKELLAAEIHRQSGLAGPLLRLNCAELAPQLIESQLFGHERGAFTGAVSAQVGLFVAAHTGTLFLDEIAEVPLDLQAKLLRVLQEGEVRPVGSVRTVRTDVRIVAATNADLAERVERGQFRRDLYARLSFFELRLPPLRARRQDILWWVDCLRDRWCRERQREVRLELRPQVAELLVLCGWPDNLRGIDRLVHRLLASNQTGEVGAGALRDAMPELFGTLPVPAASEPPARAATDRPSRDEFLEVYRRTGHSVRATSKHFGRDRRQVYRWLELFGIPREPGEE
ncbi:MAG TPA: sigma 54-interacting transcriptional regulator [Polyangiaceae bacterium]